MTPAEREGQTAARLVALAQAGDLRAFEELVRRYRRRIYALALHLTGSKSDADDIAQDVFMRAYRALPSFEGRSEFFTWVYRMAVNRALNVRRDRGRRPEDPLDDPRLELAIAVDAAGCPHRAAELRQTYARLLGGLDGLPPEMRTSVVLVALQGLSHGEAAVVQKCSEGTIAWRMHEARARLRDALGGAPKITRRRGLSHELTGLLDELGLPTLAPGRA
ncbi:MAG: sigma-70 family RNA polymerase sigma factor [Kofleriaceae bacterium]|jgi:RNA polymerase sigma-70 factor (ECF subfamily)|nr:sigma-70 family RNA polymerase sigma factor [Kofleriaceae bacterium]MBP9860844.1 sigma-70 family RNA polymerase sigma factor [Kofleriaceae bacterium]